MNPAGCRSAADMSIHKVWHIVHYLSIDRLNVNRPIRQGTVDVEVYEETGDEVLGAARWPPHDTL